MTGSSGSHRCRSYSRSSTRLGGRGSLNGSAHDLQPTVGFPTRATTYTPALDSDIGVFQGTGPSSERSSTFLNTSVIVKLVSNPVQILTRSAKAIPPFQRGETDGQSCR